jgi:hypothetical protein
MNKPAAVQRLPWPQEATLVALTACAILAALIGPPAKAEEPEEPMTLESFSDVLLLDEAARAGRIAFEGTPVEPERPAATAFAAVMRSAVGMKVGVDFNLRFGTLATYDCGSASRETRTINPAIRPWGLDGGGSENFDLFGLRYWEGRRTAGCWPSGFAAELFGVNLIALENWSRFGCFDPPLPRAGVPTSEEQYDLATTAGGRRHPLYQKCWWELQAGGHQDRPVVVTGGTWGFYRGIAQTHGICATGLHSWPSIWGWPQWMRVDELPTDLPWCASAPPPVPVPPPPPVPVPPPPSIPVCPPDRLERCQTLKSPFGQATCSGCPCPPETPSRLGVDGEPKLWYCTPQTAPPPPTCEACEVIGYTDSRCGVCPCPPGLVDGSGHVHTLPGRFCRPVTPPVETCIRYSADLYIPTVMSTGRLEIVLIPQGESPCPRETP